VCSKNVKYVKVVAISDVFFHRSKYFKTRFLLRPDPAGGAYDVPPTLLVTWAGGHVQYLPLDAFDVSISISAPLLSTPPQHKFLATPMLDVEQRRRTRRRRYICLIDLFFILLILLAVAAVI